MTDRSTKSSKVSWFLNVEDKNHDVFVYSSLCHAIFRTDDDQTGEGDPRLLFLEPGALYFLHLVYNGVSDYEIPTLPQVSGGKLELEDRKDTVFGPTPLVEYRYALTVFDGRCVEIPAFDVTIDKGATFTVEAASLMVRSELSQAKVLRTTPDCLPLLEAAHLTVYRENVFRVTGLAVDSTNKQAKRRADELKMMHEAGQVHGSSAMVFALQPPPSIDDIRHAMRRLEDPGQRIIDEFFWFWPTTFGESATDPALQALAKGDSSAAYDIWVQSEKDPATGFVATHNIAIMFHMIALDWTNYHLAADVDREREEKIRNYWKESFARWEKIVSDDRIWDAVKVRIRTVDDARLTTGFARRMRDTFPEALDKINAEAALRFAELNRLDWAKTHIAFMNESHQGLDNVEKTAALVLTPTRNRVLQHIETARNQIAKNPADGCKIAETLLDQVEPLEQLFELFHGKDSHHKTELFDEVATTVNRLVVVFQNKASGEAKIALPLYQRALQLATSIDLRQQIQKNIGVGTKSIKGKELQPLFDKLEAIQQGKASARIRFSEVKSLVSSLAGLAEEDGEESELYIDIADTFAVVLRGIALAANNNEKDQETALHAITLAGKLVKDAQLSSRIREDRQTLQSNKALADAMNRSKKVDSSGCLVLLACAVLGTFAGATCAGPAGTAGGGFLGLVAGGFASKMFKVNF